MYDIVDPDKWILENSDEGKRETMYLNFYNIDYWELISRCNQECKIPINTNIFYDYCFNEDKTMFKSLFNKDISIDPISTIEQIKPFYDDVIYEHDDNHIYIRRKSFNKWNTVLTMLFKFYGWYPIDEKTVYAKYKIFNLKSL